MVRAIGDEIIIGTSTAKISETVVAEMGGHVAKDWSTGLLALLGYPVAQGDRCRGRGTRRASIRCALAEISRKNAGTGKPELAQVRWCIAKNIHT